MITRSTTSDMIKIQYHFHDGIKRYIGMHPEELMLQRHSLTVVICHRLNFTSCQRTLFSLNES